MKLSEILSVSGTPGLYLYVAQSKGGIIVETVGAVKKRSIVSASAKVSTLGDIAIFTDSTEVALAEVFENIYKTYEGQSVPLSNKSTPAQLSDFFAKVLPDYDRGRVHNSDIKKVAQWYNALLAAGMTEFVEKNETEENAEGVATKIAKTTTPGKAELNQSAVKGKVSAASSKPKMVSTKSTTARKAQ